jgi:DUF917 family protein
MGTGGGGDPKDGIQMLSDTLERDGEVSWIDVADVPDEAWTASMFSMGSIAPRSETTQKEVERLGLKPADISLSLSIQALMDYTGVKIEAMVPFELGGMNTANPLLYGSELGLSTIDGDYAGRAVPEGAQTIPVLVGKPMTPLSGVDIWGNVCFVKEAAGPVMAERIGKMLSVAAFDENCLMTGYLMKGKEMKEVIVPGTMTKCLNLGKTIREARQNGQDPVQAIIDFSQGWLLFQGEVIKKDWENRDGYMFGTNYLQGIRDFEGHEMSVWYQNENHIVKKNGKPFVSSPDAVALVGIGNGEPITNTDITVGDRVAVVGMKGVEAFRTPDGLKLLGPEHFGFDIEYIPIEKVV